MTKVMGIFFSLGSCHSIRSNKRLWFLCMA